MTNPRYSIIDTAAHRADAKAAAAIAELSASGRTGAETCLTIDEIVEGFDESYAEWRERRADRTARGE